MLRKNKISLEKIAPEEIVAEVIEKRSVSKTIILLLLTAVAAAGLYFYKYQTKKNLDNFQNKIIPEAIKKVVGDPSVIIKDIKNLKETSGLYSFDFTFESNGSPRTYSSYISKDGAILFQSGIEIAKIGVAAAASSPAPKLTCADISKNDKPDLTAFVVADCPFGLQMQRVFKKAISEEINLKNYLTVRYLGAITDAKITSMHGDKEAQENLRQICLREEQKDKYWNLINPRNGAIVNKVSARSIFELATTYAWRNGDPGMIFLDRINRDNPTPQIGVLEAVNLCGEQPLLNYEACNLGSVNLAKHVSGKDIEWEKLAGTVKIGVRLLDDAISICKYPLKKIRSLSEIR